MEKNPTWIPVVALALFDQEGRILMQQRTLGRHHGGMWEFPGGKVENGEIPRLALVREIAEDILEAIHPGSNWVQDSAEGPREMSKLTLDTTQARALLGWRDHLAGEALSLWTADWYSACAAGAGAP